MARERYIKFLTNYPKILFFVIIISHFVKPTPKYFVISHFSPKRFIKFFILVPYTHPIKISFSDFLNLSSYHWLPRGKHSPISLFSPNQLSFLSLSQLTLISLSLSLSHSLGTPPLADRTHTHTPTTAQHHHHPRGSLLPLPPSLWNFGAPKSRSGELTDLKLESGHLRPFYGEPQVTNSSTHLALRFLHLDRRLGWRFDRWQQFYSVQFGVGFMNKITAEEEKMKKLS